MRYLSIYKTTRPDHRPPTEEMMNKMGAFMAECVQKGVLIATEGVGASTPRDLKVRLYDGALTTLDGPFTEAKEMIGGFAILSCKTREELIEFTRRFLEIAGDGECEIHPLSDQSPMDMFK